MGQAEHLKELRDRLNAFVARRDWSRFHHAKNLAMALASEAGELLAELRWVATSVLRTMPDGSVEGGGTKLAINETNYPVSASKGRADRPQVPNRGASIGEHE
jgi:hypothetical protein